MALGDSYNNNEQKEKKYNPTVTSEYRMSNPEGIDPSALSFSFWNGLLNIKIAPKKANSNDEFASYDYDNAASVFISHGKARVLVEEIKRFRESNGSIDNVGISTKHGLLSVCDGKSFGVSGPLLVVRDLDPSNGSIVAKYIYQFKTGFHYGIENFNESDSQYVTNNYDYLELDQFVTILEQYYLSMTNAFAYSVINANRFNDARVKNDLDAIRENLGIPKSGNYSNKNTGGNFFKSNNTTSNNTSFSDIQNKISSLDD